MGFFAYYPSSSSTLPTGAATSANQVLEITALNSIDGKTPSQGQKTMANSSPVVIASDQSAIAITAATLPLPSGAATSALQTSGNASLTSIDSKLTSPLAVTGPLTDAQLRATPVPISGSISATNPSVSATGAAVPAQATYGGMNVSGNLTGFTGTANGLKVDGSAVTQPVSGPLTDTQLRATAVPVSGTVAATQSGTWNINNISGTISLPTGAATDTVATANGVLIGAVNETAPASDTASSGLNGRLQRIAQRITSLIALFPASLGQKTMANSLAVVVASDQSAIPVSGTVTATAGNFVQATRLDFASTNVTTAAYVQLIASTSANITQIELYTTVADTLLIAVGAAASEVDKNYIMPGGNNGPIPLTIASGSRVSIKAVTGNVSFGYININFYG